MPLAAPDEIGKWSEEKLELLRRYLGTYTGILKNKSQSWCRRLHYIDAFSGSVWHLSKDCRKVIAGSPLLALRTTPQFDTFTFIEKNRQRITGFIEPLQKSFPDRQISIEQGDCNDILINKLLPEFQKHKKTERGFIFLDPYGINLQFTTVEAIAATGMFDVFINLSVSGVYRQLSDRPPQGALRAGIDRLMGTPKWFGEAYRESRQLSLLGDPALERQGNELAERLALFYRKRLTGCFKHVSRYVMMRAPNNAPLYALILASHADLAVQRMHEIFQRREKRGGTWLPQP